MFRCGVLKAAFSISDRLRTIGKRKGGGQGRGIIKLLSQKRKEYFN